MLPTIDLTGSEQEIERIIAWAKQRPEIDQVSEPMSLDASRAMNVGLPEIREVLEFATVVFTTGTASLAFLKALRDELKTWRGVVAVSDPVSGEPLGRIDSETSDSEITQMVSK